MNKLKEIIREEVYKLLEGGNISGVNSVVPIESLEPTISNGLITAGFKRLKFSVVGNKNKPFLGDVDVAVDSKDVSKEIGYRGSDANEFWLELDKYLNKQKLKGYKIAKGLSQFHLIVPLIDKNKKHISAHDKSGKELDEPGYVQLDIFIGDLNWMKKALSASSSSSKYKAVYRNLFLTSLLSQLIFKTRDPDIKRKLQINWKQGVEVVDFTTDDKGKRKKLKVKKVIGDMDKFVKFLFGASTRFKDIDSFEKLYNLFSSNKFRYPDLRKSIVDEFNTTLQKIKINLPDETK